MAGGEVSRPGKVQAPTGERLVQMAMDPKRKTDHTAHDWTPETAGWHPSDDEDDVDTGLVVPPEPVAIGRVPASRLEVRSGQE